MFRSVRPYLVEAGIDDRSSATRAPSSPTRARASSCGTSRSRSSSRGTIAVLGEEGFHVNCYVDDELYVDEVTPEAERYAGFQNLPLHEVGDLAAWLSPPTKLVAIDDPDLLDGLEVRMKARFDGRLYISKSLPFFLEFASPEVTKGSGLGFLPSIWASRASAPSPSATARTTSSSSSGPASASRSRTRTRACSRPPTGSAPRPPRREWPRSWKRF